MSLLFIQYWDVIQEREDEYGQYVDSRYLPQMSTLGFVPVGGYYVEVGFGPRTITVFSSDSLDDISKIVAGKDFRDLALGMRKYVTNFKNIVLEPSGIVKLEKYPVQKSVWKYNHYYDLKPETGKAYEDFLTDEYLPAMQQFDYVKVTNCWNVVFGGFCDIVLEFTLKDPEYIGRLLKEERFRKITRKLQGDFVANYTNRIQRSTRWFREPKWFRR